MRQTAGLVLGAFLSAGLAGCGSNEAPIRKYVADLTNFSGGFKQARRREFPGKVKGAFGSETTGDAIIKALQEDVVALKELNGTLSDEERLQLQLKYGPVVEGLAIDIANQIASRIFQKQEGNAPPPGFVKAGGVLIYLPMLNGKLAKDDDAPFLVKGYATVVQETLKDMEQLVKSCERITRPADAEVSLPAVRKLRYRLALDGVRLRHLESRVKEIRDTEQKAIRGSFKGLVDGIHGQEDRLRDLPGTAGRDVVNAIEPLPSQILDVITPPPGPP